MGDVSTPALMVAALVTGVGTAIISLYSNFRQAKFEADRREDELTASKLAVAQMRVRDLERELARYRPEA